MSGGWLQYGLYAPPLNVSQREMLVIQLAGNYSQRRKNILAPLSYARWPSLFLYFRQCSGAIWGLIFLLIMIFFFEFFFLNFFFLLVK